MGRFEGKIALVTGATRGLGVAIARQLHSEGATLILSGRDDERGGSVERELTGSEYWHLNVAEEADWVSAANRLRERELALHVLVNNAAIVRYEPIATCGTAAFREVLDVNLMGVFFGIRELGGLMPAGGSIVNISSCAGLEGINGACSYVASKWAVTGLTRAAALELGHRGIRVNSVHPHAIATELIAAQATSMGSEIFDRQALSRIGEPDEIARLVSFLASSDSSYCTGGAYLVDGGYLAGQVVKSMALS